MKNTMITKMEHPDRLTELAPHQTLYHIGFKDGMNLADIGAGTGVFTFAAAKISRADIFALDISDELLELISERKIERKLPHVTPIKVTESNLPLPTNSCDMALLVTVLHDLADQAHMLSEIRRILKSRGKFLLVEFHNQHTPYGPPLHIRIPEDKVLKLCRKAGFKDIEHICLGENLYAILFQ